MSGAGVQPDVLEVASDVPRYVQTPEMSPGCCMSGEVGCRCKDLLGVYR